MCPMRTFAMTGMDTASWMPLIMAGSLMRETPPAARMSAGMRSSAMTAHAPASSAICACSGVVTSMITPPLSIWARLLVEFRTILRHEFPFVRRCLVSRFIIERSGLAPPKPVQFGWGQFATSAPIQSNLHMFISPIWHVIPDCQSITGQEEKSWHACDYLLFASSASPEMPSTYSRMSPGWQSNAAQMAARAEKRMAETRLFLILERFTLVMPT